MWRRRSRNPEPVPPDLAAECAAFLAGRYALQLEERGARVPVWAWTNLLAHATEQELRDMLSSPSRTRIRALTRWRHACSYVVGEVLDLAEQRGSLRELQAAVLIPLELELTSRPDANGWGPGQWVAAVMAILHDDRHTRPRP
jgi:hypothetical protein